MIIDHYRELMNRNGAAVMDVRYVVERDTAAFEAARTTVGMVCADDSLTGWNNFGPAAQWSYRTPEETDEILANPGMGWETFHRTAKQDKNLPPWIPSTVHYARWGWRDLEPRPGKIDDAFLNKVLGGLQEDAAGDANQREGMHGTRHATRNRLAGGLHGRPGQFFANLEPHAQRLSRIDT